MTKRNRPIELHVYLNEEENKILEAKYNMSAKKNKSAFLRQLILKGFVYDIDFKELQRYNYLLSNISGNINQIAHRINETRSIYKPDIDGVKEEMKKLWQLQKSMLSDLHLGKL